MRLLGDQQAQQRIRANQVMAYVRAHAAIGACLILLLAAFAFNFTRPLDTGLSAWRAQMLQRPASGQVVVVEIDSASLNAAGEWPWPRARFAQAIDQLHAAGVGLIALDVDFGLRADSANDSALHDAIAARPLSVILPSFMQPNGDINQPLAPFQANALTATVNIPVDDDGQVRRYAYGFERDGGRLATLAALVAGRADARGEFLIDYGVRAASIPRLSFDDVLHGRFDPAQIKDRSIIIGATALELGDEFSTPAHPALPGVYVHALAAESITQHRALTSLAPAPLMIIALLVLALLWPRRALSRRGALKQAAALALLLATPLAVQAVFPVSIDLGVAILAQTLCVGVAISRELKRRADMATSARESALRHAALHDLETGLPNRRAILAHLNTLPAHGSFAILALGVERMTTLRAAVGYTRANQALTQLAQRLTEREKLGPAFRLSTSVLGFVVPDTHKPAPPPQLQTRYTVIIGGSEIDLDVRTGYAIHKSDETAEQALEHAGEALNHARATNTRTVNFGCEIFDPKLQLAISSDVARGIARGDFFLVYQPKVHARTGDLSGLEALLRWSHPDLGDIPPASFIAAAEETGSIEELTSFVVDQALRDQRHMRLGGVDTRVSVNISARSLASVAFCNALIDKMSSLAHHFCVEITETAVISDPPAAIAALNAFRMAGIEISIDDYGAGLSSLAYLKQINAHELKLDRALVVGARTSRRDRFILKSTIDLAHGLGMKVVAEGVEDEATCAILSTLGCDALQGFAIMKPAPLADILLRYGVSISKPSTPNSTTTSRATK